MEIKTLATGSAGNCYKIDDGHTSLLLECGLPIKDIQKALNFKLNNISACLVTHRHQDHTRGLKDILKKEIDVYMPELEIKAMGLKHHRMHPIQPLKQFTIGSWVIMPFHTEHDTEQPVGYLMQSTATNEKLLFATDTYYIRYKFKGVTHFLIECNYSDKIIKENLEHELIGVKRHNRTVETHFSLENLIKFLKSCDLSKAEEIRLIHLSDANSHEGMFKREVTAATGVPTKIEDIRGF